jgi:predicted signal transduction protein with EAL and GGDEF domain
VYRIGGDEFVLVVPHRRDQRGAVDIVTSLLHRLSERYDIDGHGVFIAASAGMATGPRDGTDIEHLMSNADLALYNAKDAGGRTYRVFQPVLRARAEMRRHLDADLRRAFAASEFVLHYQPQIRLSDGAVVGAEALLRWKHPEKGLLTPASFIEALAGSTVALDVGRWILRTACASAAAWRERGIQVRVGVNLFPVHFRDGTLKEDVEAALVQAGLPADGLELEITENIALGQHEEMLVPLRAIRDMGVGLAFDDFGTGYASLSYLTRYPLSRIKIDRSFVDKIGGNPTREESAIVRSIIVLAHNLGLRITAEGVEDAAQEAFLRVQRCDEVQGYYYARPLPGPEFEEFARSNRLCLPRALAG